MMYCRQCIYHIVTVLCYALLALFLWFAMISGSCTSATGSTPQRQKPVGLFGFETKKLGMPSGSSKGRMLLKWWIGSWEVILVSAGLSCFSVMELTAVFFKPFGSLLVCNFLPSFGACSLWCMTLSPQPLLMLFLILSPYCLFWHCRTFSPSIMTFFALRGYWGGVHCSIGPLFELLLSLENTKLPSCSHTLIVHLDSMSILIIDKWYGLFLGCVCDQLEDHLRPDRYGYGCDWSHFCDHSSPRQQEEVDWS